MSIYFVWLFLTRCKIFTSSINFCLLWFQIPCVRTQEWFEAYYQLNFKGKVIASGESFGLGETKEFDMPGP